MRYELNGFPVSSIEIGSPGIWFIWKSCLYPYLSYGNGDVDYKELQKVSPCNLLHNGLKGRKSKTYINSEGLCEWICRTMRFTPHERIGYINELKSLGLVPSDFSIQLSRKELDFFSELQQFSQFSGINYSISRQVPLCDNFIVDAVVNSSLVVEFDENCHLSYDSELEGKREKEIINLGYSLIRITDKMSTGEGIGLVYKSLNN